MNSKSSLCNQFFVSLELRYHPGNFLRSTSHIITRVTVSIIVPFFNFQDIYLFIYSKCLFLRESMSEGGVETERGTEDLKRALSWQQPVCVGLKLLDCEIMTWAAVRRSTDWATQVPQDIYLIRSFFRELLRIALTAVLAVHETWISFKNLFIGNFWVF